MHPLLTTFFAPALAAGLVAILVTRAVELLGGRRGGILGTAPTTIVPASIGFHLHATDVEAFRDALWVVPSGMFLSAMFLWLWRTLPPHVRAPSLVLRLTAMTVLTLGAWSALALVMVWGVGRWRDAGGSMPAFGVSTFVFAWLVGLAACWIERPAPAGSRPVSGPVLVSRGIMAALAVGGAVALQGVAGPFVAGVLSVFPAIFLTTMVSLWWSQGEAVPAGAVGPMMLGSTAVSAYALLATVAMPALGTTVGALTAWSLAVVFVTVPSGWLLERRPWARRAG